MYIYRVFPTGESLPTSLKLANPPTILKNHPPVDSPTIFLSSPLEIKNYFSDAVRNRTRYSEIRVQFSCLPYDLSFVSNETAKKRKSKHC